MSNIELVIRTSDRAAFRRCRRKWGWSSHLRHNLGSRESRSPLWTGSGVHFALEDFHGYNHYGSPAQAFKEFLLAWRKMPGLELPMYWEQDTELATAMMDYYSDEWLQNRDPLITYYEDDKPQVEVSFKIPIPIHLIQFPLEMAYGADVEVFYTGTFDRISIDEHGRLWIVEYKTAKVYQQFHFDTDAQINAYMWAAKALYNKPIAGVVYQQHRKVIPEGPATLATGKISTRKQMITSRPLYKKALVDLYTSIDRAPNKNVVYLNELAAKENEYQDAYVRRDLVERNQSQIESEGVKILLELEEILNPNAPLYPNPTKDCNWECDFSDACVAMDDGGDWQSILDDVCQPRTDGNLSWRKHLRAA